MTARVTRVVQWTTGNVGTEVGRRDPRESRILNWSGCYAWSPEKVGRMSANSVGSRTVGVLATDDRAALFALRPDCVVYNPKWPVVDELSPYLETGINVVTTAAFITGHAFGADREDSSMPACVGEVRSSAPA